MFKRISTWLRRNAYGQFASRILFALGSAAVAVALSYFPHDTILQAVWVVVSSMCMGYMVLRQRLNETDDVRYRRLFRGRFAHLEMNDPESLTTIFAENIRQPVFDWFETEYGIKIRDVKAIDALDSLARSGDPPGRLIFRTGVELGKWLEQSEGIADKRQHLESRLAQFVIHNESLLGAEVGPGVFVRHVRRGEQRPVGIHMFHPCSRLLFAVEYYDSDQTRHSVALSGRSFLFDSIADAAWQDFKQAVYREFPCFQPSNGGSGPQKPTIPFFVSTIHTTPVQDPNVLTEKLLKLADLLPAGETTGPIGIDDSVPGGGKRSRNDNRSGNE